MPVLPDPPEPFTIASRPTAVIHVSVYPIGVPGRVLVTVESSGPVELSNTEMRTVLLQAADQLD